MVLESAGRPLRPTELPDPEPGPGELLLEVSACGVCRTDLHILDGELQRAEAAAGAGPPDRRARAAAAASATRPARASAFPGSAGPTASAATAGAAARTSASGPIFTGYGRDGGFAELAVADERFCFPIPEGYPDLQAAPLLCAGLIGFRTLRMAGDAERLGIYGFGAAAHIVCQVARHEGRRVFAFTRAGDRPAQEFALELGAEWAGDALGPAPEELDAALIFAPAGELVPAALRAVAKGGSVVCGGIHMSDIPSFPYELLWGERVLRSVANLTRADGEEFLALAPRVPVRTRGRDLRPRAGERGARAPARRRPARRRGRRAAGGVRRRADSAVRAPGPGARPRGRRSRAQRRSRARRPVRRPSRSASCRLSTCVRVRVEAGAPVDDPVGLRVDADEPDSARHRLGQVGPEGRAALVLEAGALEEPGSSERAEPRDRLDLQAHERVDRERVELRRAERDHAADEVRPPPAEHPRDRPAAALADDDGSASLFRDELLEQLLEPRDDRARAVHVQPHPGPARPVAGALQPAGHHRERAVAGEEARDQEHRAAAALGRRRRRAGSGRAAAPRSPSRSEPPARAGARHQP